MADFDAFESAPNPEMDPAADFLAREQDELAGLEDDNFGMSQPAQNGIDAFGEDQNIPQAQDEQNNASSGLGDFEVIGDVPASFEQNSFEDNSASDSQFNGPSNAYAAIAQQDTMRAEPEKIRIWREEQKERLEKKDEEENKKKEELHEIAKKELDDWYRHHQEQLEKTKDNNRKFNDVTESQGAAESAFVKDRDETIPGQAWEKITKLCEFNPKNSKTTKDVSRLRSILLQLKQTPLVR